MTSVGGIVEPVVPVAGASRAPAQAVSTPQEAPQDHSAQSKPVRFVPEDTEPRPKAPMIPQNALRLTVDPETHEVIAAIVDPTTNAVVREVPPEEMRKASQIIRAILGRLVDKVV
jgi:FlaG protein